MPMLVAGRLPPSVRPEPVGGQVSPTVLRQAQHERFGEFQALANVCSGHALVWLFWTAPIQP